MDSPDFIISKAAKYLASGAPWEVFLARFSNEGLDEIIAMCNQQKVVNTNYYLNERFPAGERIIYWQRQHIGCLILRAGGTLVTTNHQIYKMLPIKGVVKGMRRELLGPRGPSRRKGAWKMVVNITHNRERMVEPDNLTKIDEPPEMSSLYEEVMKKNTKSMIDELRRISTGPRNTGGNVYSTDEYPGIWDQISSKILVEPDLETAWELYAD